MKKMTESENKWIRKDEVEKNDIIMNTFFENSLPIRGELITHLGFKNNYGFNHIIVFDTPLKLKQGDKIQFCYNVKDDIFYYTVVELRRSMKRL